MQPGAAVPSIARAPASGADLDGSISELGAARSRARFGTSWSLGSAPISPTCACTPTRRGAGQRGAQADAFTYGSDIYFGAGKRSVAPIELTAHELSHVVQQRWPVPAWRPTIQPSFSASYQVTPRYLRGRHADARGRREHASDAQRLRRLHPLRARHRGAELEQDRLHPDREAHRCRRGGRHPVSMPAAQSPRGALGDPGVRTEDNADPASRAGSSPTSTIGRTRPRRAPPRARRCRRATTSSRRRPAGSGKPASPSSRRSTGAGPEGCRPDAGVQALRATRPTSARPRSTTRPAIVPHRQPQLRVRVRGQGEDTMVIYGAVKWGFGLRTGKVVERVPEHR